MRVQGPDGAVIDFGDATPEEIKAAMRRHYGGPTSPQGYQADPSLRAGFNRYVAGFGIGRKPTPEALPVAGGIAGGLMGGTLGAGVGGMVGEGAKQFITRRPDLAAIPLQGMKQAAFEGVGRGIESGLARVGARWIPKTVAFQKADVPSVILDQFQRPIMKEGANVTFTKGPTKAARQAAGMAADVVSHAMGPVGILAKPALRAAQGNAASRMAPVGRFLTSYTFRQFARQSPRAAAAIYQLLSQQEPDSTTASFARR